uniref:Uncharacterized protein n=1 Tax=Oryza nivara TaxID=4536 RepID=A0A0E0J8Q8_ORYNI
MAMPWETLACILRNVWALLDGWIAVCCLAADELAGLLRSALGSSVALSFLLWLIIA